jgi:predicted O-methyltransferase YrrM
VHGGRATFGVSPALCRFLDGHLAPGAVVLETGSGLSSIVILRRGVARLISVTPYANEFETIQTFCAKVGIPTAAWQPVAASSLDWLPSATLPPLDLVLIDGSHAFPAPCIDWHYTSESLKVGGLVVVDDLQLVTARILADFLRADQRWDEVHRDQRFGVYRKRVHPIRDEQDWLAQAWVTGSTPVAAVRIVREGPVRRALRLATRLCTEPAALAEDFRRWRRTRRPLDSAEPRG